MTTPSIDAQITFLDTVDLSETARFYETIMELPLVVDQGQCRIYQTGEDAYVGFCERDLGESAAEFAAAHVILTLVTDDVDGWHAHLKNLGVEIEKPPNENPRYGIYQCFARDPNGYLIEIQRFLDENWRGGR